MGDVNDAGINEPRRKTANVSNGFVVNTLNAERDDKDFERKPEKGKKMVAVV